MFKSGLKETPTLLNLNIKIIKKSIVNTALDPTTALNVNREEQQTN